MSLRWIIPLVFATAVAVACVGWSTLMARQRRPASASDVDMWAHVSGPRKVWSPVGQLDTNVVRESSGLIASRRHDGVFWTHSDSFNEAAIYAITEGGPILSRVEIDAPHGDWEDIAADDAGFLYIADIGNNFRLSAVRHVHKIREPDPYGDGGERVSPVATYTFTYPDKRFDAEAFVVRGDRMYLISRHDRNRARIYDLEPDARNVVTLHENAALRAYRASGADLSADGSRLAVCTTRQTWIYAVDEAMVPRDGVGVTFARYPNDQVEGCCFDGDDLVLTNERGQVFRISATDIENGVIFVPQAVRIAGAGG